MLVRFIGNIVRHCESLAPQ